MAKSLLKTSLIYTVAGMLPMASAIVLLPLYVNNLSTEVYGALTIYTVFTYLVQIMVTFSFDSSIYIHYHEFKTNPKQLSAFVSTAFVFMLMVGAVATVLLGIGGDLIFKLVMPDNKVTFFPYGLASVGAGAFQAIFKVHSALLQTREKPETFLWSNVLSFTLTAAFTVIGMRLYPHSLAGPIYGRLLGALIPTSWALIRIYNEFGLRYDFSWLRASLGYNIYTFVYQLQQWVINQFDRVLMLTSLTLSDAGIYDFAVKCLIPIELLMNNLHNSFYPKVISSMIGKTDQSSSMEINRYYHGLNAIVSLLITGSIFAVPIVIVLFSKNAEYERAIQYVPFLATVYFFKAMRLYFAFPYNTMKYTKPLPVMYAIVVVIKVSLMLLLMPHLKIYGVVIASVASAIGEVFMLKYFIKKKFTFKYNAVKIVIAPVLMMLLIVIVEPFGGGYGWITHGLYVVVSLLLLLWVYRNEVSLINPFKTLR